MEVTDKIDWPALVFEPDFMSSITRLALRRFVDEGLAEECSSFVIEGLSYDAWARCKAFKGNAKPSTFLYTLVNNLIEEFARKKFGRPRPPTWVKDHGDLWVSLWKAVCMERQLIPTVIDRFCQGGLRAKDMVEHAIKVIKARIPTCGQAGFREQSSDTVEAWSDAEGQVTEGSDGSMQEEGQVLGALGILLESILSERPTEINSLAEAQESPLYSHFGKQFKELQTAISLSDEERLLLRMIYTDGLSKQKAAVAIGLQPHQGGRIVNQALQRVREQMQDMGMDLGTLMNALV